MSRVQHDQLLIVQLGRHLLCKRMMCIRCRADHDHVGIRDHLMDIIRDEIRLFCQIIFSGQRNGRQCI